MTAFTTAPVLLLPSFEDTVFNLALWRLLSAAILCLARANLHLTMRSPPFFATFFIVFLFLLGINWISTVIAHILAFFLFDSLSLHWPHLFRAIWKQFECYLHIAFRRMLLMLLMEMLMALSLAEVGSLHQKLGAWYMALSTLLYFFF